MATGPSLVLGQVLARQITENSTCPNCVPNYRSKTPDFIIRVKDAPLVPSTFQGIQEQKIRGLAAKTQAICPRCRTIWQRPSSSAPWFTSVPAPLSGRPSPSALRIPYGIPQAQKSPTVNVGRTLPPLRFIGPEQTNVISIRELSRTQEAIGDQSYSFDHSQTTSTATETIRVSQQTTVSVFIGMEKLRTALGDFGLTFMGFGVQGKLEKVVRNTYNITTASELTLSQDTTINIPARKHVQVILHWKKIWQHGSIGVLAEGHPFVIPYALTIALNFDTETLDVRPPARGGAGPKKARQSRPQGRRPGA
jgi:hypothetical protein